MKLTRYLFLLFFLIINISVFPTEFTPVVTQFNKKDYAAGNQNWAVAQDSRGMVYFANNVGLLRFDGVDFSLFKMPNEQIVRAVYIDKADRIYVGSFREFGYFEQDKYGQLSYTSLADQLTDYTMDNDEIWKITEFQGKILFQSFKSIFIFDSKHTQGKRYDETFLFIQPFNGQLYTHTLQHGFCRFDLSKKQFVKVPATPFRSAAIAVVPFSPSQAYIATESEGIFTFDGENFHPFFGSATAERLRTANVNKALLTRDSMLVVGTILDGITAIDKNGKKVWTLNTTNNLQNNTVLGMHCDPENNLWLALDKGIAVVQLNKPIRFIRSFSPSVGSIYSLRFREPNTLYLATNQGLYTGHFSLGEGVLGALRIDPVIKGQVWTLSEFDGQLFCGNNEETCEIYPSRRIIGPGRGGMCMEQGVIHGREVLVEGTYSDICIYTKTGGQWQFFSTVRGFLNPIKSIAVDYQGRIWAAHMHRGLYMIRLKPDLSSVEEIRDFGLSKVFKSASVNVFLINNRVVFADNFGFYLYDDIKNELVPYEALNTAFGNNTGANRVVRQQASKYWFIRAEEALLVDLAGDKVQVLDKVPFSFFQNQTVDNYQHIVPVADDAALFTLENGLALYRLRQHTNTRTADTPLRLRLMEVQVLDKNTEEKTLLPVDSDAEQITFPHTKNRIRFKVGFPHFAYHNDLMFSYKLSGLNDNWSEKTTLNTKEYSYLAPGNYVFSVQVLTKSGEPLATGSYAFHVRPPFYRSAYAKIVYVLLIFLMLHAVVYFIKRNFEQKKHKIRQEEENIRKKEIEKREMEIVALKAEKLEADLALKSKELAMSAMTIIRKNEVLSNVKHELDELKKLLGAQYPNKYYERMTRLLDRSISSDDDWAVFQTNFDRIHENFFRNLHEKYPELTSNDLRFCAYFRLNLPTKDIAQLMNISIKGVEVARYRIRKKLNIPSEKNITEFMIEFK